MYSKQFLQFNDLVFEGLNLVSSSGMNYSTKTTSEEYTFKHGSYVAHKKDYVLFKEQRVSLTLYFSVKPLPCDMRPFYRSFIIEQITKPGKLWAVQNNRLIWAYAYVTSIGESDDPSFFVFDVDFALPEGVWHKADYTKTFLLPHNICTYLDCYEYKAIDPCGNKGSENCCVSCVKTYDANECSCCDCNLLTKDMSLCYYKDRIGELFNSNCLSDYMIKYDCVKGQEFFGDMYLGERICIKDDCSSIIAGQFYSDTDIPTQGVTVVLSGTFHNPHVTINDNTNVILGDYDGALIIQPTGDVYFQQNTCCISEALDPSIWVKPDGMNYGWTVYPRNNRIIVNPNTCCSGQCVYVQTDAITI